LIRFQPFESDFEWHEGVWTATDVLKYIPSAVREFVSPCLLPWTFAILGLRLLRPRPSLRRISLQPGFVACCASSISIAMTVGELLLAYVIKAFVRAAPPWLSSSDKYREHLLDELHELHLDLIIVGTSPMRITYVVTTAWLLLALGKRCRPEPSWIDRSGRIIGVLWIAIYLIEWMAQATTPYQFQHHQSGH
jgi:hypothetical protein